MRKILPILLCLVSVCLQAETYRISFNYSETGSDGTQATTDRNKLIRQNTYDFVVGVDAQRTNNVYVGKNGYGLKGGTGSAGGKLTLLLDTTYTVRTITLYAAAGNKADTAATKGIKVCGTTINWQTPRLQLQPYVVPLNKPLNELTIEALAAKNCRFYIEHMELDIVDTYPHRGKIQMPCISHKFPSAEYDSIQPAQDEETFELLAEGITAAGIHLQMKNGSTYTVSPTDLPAQGGEFTISYSSTAQPSFYEIIDTCIITATGENNAHLRRAMGVSVIIKEYKPLDIDSTGMLISISPGNYYDAANRLRGEQLKSALGAIINCGVRYRYGSGRNHTWDAFYSTDRDTTTNQVLDMYSLNERYFNPAKPTASVAEFDIEHMLPKSWWGGTVNKAYCDLFHLVPGDYSANRSKSNHAPGMVVDTTFWNGSFATGSDASGRKVFCPADEYKGDFARAYFYIATCYGDSLSWDMTTDAAGAMTNTSWQEFEPWLRDLLMEWHREDPVSEKEIARAIAVNRIQGNRNPFIDYPELAEYIWGEHQNKACQLSELTPTFSGGTPTRLILHTRSAAARKALEQGQLIIYVNQQRYDAIGRKR